MNRRFCFGRVGSTWRCFNCAGVARLGRGLANLRASHLGNRRLMVMSLVWLVVDLAEGIGNAPISVETDPVFGIGAASLAAVC